MITFTDAWRRATISRNGTMTILAHKTSAVGWTVAPLAPTRTLHVDADTLEFQPAGAHQVAALANLGHQLLQEITAYRPEFAWKSTPAEIIGALAEEVHESAGTQAGDRLGALLAAIHDGVPLEEPVSVSKAMMARRKARVVLDKGTGPLAAVHLVNISVGGWTHNETTATAYANGFNRGAEWLRSSILEYAYKLQQAEAMTSVSAAMSDVIAERRRQISSEGYDIAHDDEHVNDEIAAYATFYAMPPAVRDWPAEETGYGATWGQAVIPANWGPAKPGNRRQELVKAAALLIAEIERLDRAKTVTEAA